MTIPILLAALVHFPVLDAVPEKNLTLQVEAPEDYDGKLIAHFRSADGGDWHDTAFHRTSLTTYEASITGDAVMYPGLEYFIDAAADGRTLAISGSPTLPHPVLVALDRSSIAEVALARRGGKRSTVRVTSELVNHGRSQLIGQENRSDDYYYRGEAAFSYRFTKFVQGLSVGIGVLEGRAPTGSLGAETPLSGIGPDFRAGYRYGFAELHVGDAFVGGYGKLLLGINHETFGVGAEGKLRIGFDPGTRFEVGVGTWSVLGTFASFGLAWDTVPKFPMAATVFVGNLPNNQDAAVRLAYDAGWQVTDRVQVNLRASYQARSARYGGLGGGAGVSFDF